MPVRKVDFHAQWDSNAIAETGTDFGTNCVLNAAVERVDYPNQYPFRGRYAYVRKG